MIEGRADGGGQRVKLAVGMRSQNYLRVLLLWVRNGLRLNLGGKLVLLLLLWRNIVDLLLLLLRSIVDLLSIVLYILWWTSRRRFL